MLTIPQSSVRHNLSSNRAFMKMERCGGDRGKGFFWSIDGKHAQNLEEQEIKALQNASHTGSQDGMGKPGKRKDKTILEPPLKRSIKGEPKGPLPPPLTSIPLIPKANSSVNSNTVPNPNAATGVFSYNAQAHASSSQSQRSASYSATHTNPYAVLAHVNWNPQSSAAVTKSMTSIPVQPPLTTNLSAASASTVTPTPTSAKPTLPPINTNSVPDVVLPIVLEPIPPTHPDYVPDRLNNSAKVGYMILHERKLILDPDVFSGLTPEMLKELEKMGAMAAVKVLTGHMVRALKERRAKSKIKDKSAKKAAKAAKKAAVAAATATSTVVDTNTSLSPGSAPQIATNALPDDNTVVDPGSPLIIIDDSEDEGPASKRRKLNDGGTSTAELAPIAV
jgi:forkhead box protein K